MIAMLGSAIIALAIPLMVYSLLAPLIGLRVGDLRWQRSGYRGTAAVAMLLSLAAGLLIVAFLTNDFSIAYVYGHSNRSMPIFYKVAGLWAGLDGSLLFWVWILSLLTAILMRRLPHKAPRMAPYSNAVLLLIMLFFAVMMLVPANPFALLTSIPVDGQGLNPLLQNEYMVIHPPSLYMGYVSAAIPFALGIGAVMARQMDAGWIALVRPWMYLCWIFLTLGNLLGMHWAYVELGWGGFWAWDPVENAAAIPWFTLTAFLHSIIVQERRGMFRIWNVVLVTLTCLLTIFGTYLTRSGIVQSVHAFSGSTLGPYFLVLMGVIALIAVVAIVTHRRDLATPAHLQSVFCKEGTFILNNILLVVAAVAIIFGTMLPTFSEWWGSERMSVGPSFFNRMMAPLGVAVLILMGVGPVASWIKQDILPLLRKIWPGALAALVVGVNAWLLGIHNGYMLSMLSVVAFAFVLTLREFISGTRAMAQKHQCNVLMAAHLLLQHNRRRYGGYWVHIGFFLMCLGFAGAAYQSERIVQLNSGDAATFHGYEFKLLGLKYDRDTHKEAISAKVEVRRQDKLLTTLHPAHYLFTTAKQPSTEVDIYRTLPEDVYLILGGFDYDKKTAELKIMINPLVNMLWWGGAMTLLGALWIIWPRRSERHA